MIKRTLKALAKVAWFIPAFLLWASYPPIGEKTDVFFALAPLIWFARNRSPRESFRLWFLNGFFFWAGTLAWMPAIVKNGGPWYLVILGWGALAAYCALYFGLFGYLSSRIWQTAQGAYRKRLLAIFVAEPILWAGLELVRSRLMGGFAWNHLGVAAVNSGFGGSAALGGVYLLSAMIVLVNGTFASIAERMLKPWMDARKRVLKLGGENLTLDAPVEEDSSRKREGALRYLRSVETVLPFLVIWGVHTVGRNHAGFRPDGDSRVLTVALVQRNFPCVFKGPDKNPIEVYEKLLGNAAPFSPDLVVLPESAFCEFALFDTPKGTATADWMLKTADAKAVLAGGSRINADKELFNSAALYSRDSDGGISERIYDKVHLVPFGEFIPGDKLIPALQKLSPVGSCTPGEPKLLEFDGVKFGVAICYEDTDSALVRRFAEMGADALVFITNDSWFSESDEAVQHTWQAIARAVETGLPVIRVGNSGVTGVFYPDGRRSWLAARDGSLLVDAPGCKVERVRVLSKERRSSTPYVKYGDIPLLALFLVVVPFAFVRKWYNRRGV